MSLIPKKRQKRVSENSSDPLAIETLSHLLNSMAFN